MTRTRLIVAAGGVALLGLLIGRLGAASLSQLSALGPVAPALAASLALRLAWRTWNLRAALRAENVPATAGTVLGARLASEAAGYLSVAGPLVAEPLKPLLLGRPGSARQTVTATVVDTAFYWVSSTALILAGALGGLLHAGDGRSAAAMALVAGAVSAAAAGLVLPHRPLLPLLRHRLEGRLGRDSRWASGLLRAAEVERRVRSFRRRHPARSVEIFARDLLCQAARAGEVAAILWAGGAGFDPLAVLGIESAIRIVKTASFFVPGRIGADEAGAAGAFLLFGFNPALGLSLALGRRFQALARCSAGMMWLSYRPSSEKRKGNLHASADPVTSRL